MFNSNSPSLADIAAVTDGNRNNNDGFGNGMGGWWVLIILLALFGGFGGNWGNNGRNNSGSNDIVVVPFPTGGYGSMMGGYGYGFGEAALQRGFDTQSIISKLDGISNGICGLGYDQLAQMNAINNTVQQTGWNLANAVRDGQIAGMQQAQALSTQLANCCCENRQGQAQISYDMATQACAIKTEIANATRDIMANDDCNFRSLNDTVRNGFQTLINNQKDAEIAELRQKLSDSNLASSLQSTASYIVNKVRPTPEPTFNVPNPYCCNTNVGYNNGGCGNNLGCCA